MTQPAKRTPLTREQFAAHIAHLLAVFAENNWDVKVDDELKMELRKATDEFLTQLFGEDQ
jgi:hypothetical protein